VLGLLTGYYFEGTAAFTYRVGFLGLGADGGDYLLTVRQNTTN